MDFITDLPPCGGFNGIYTCVDKLTKFVKLIPVSIGEGALSAPEVARLFFESYCVIVWHPSCGFAWSWCPFYSPLLALFVGIIGFSGCIIISLPPTDGWADRTYSLDSGISYPLCFGLAWVPWGTMVQTPWHSWIGYQFSCLGFYRCFTL